MCTNYILRYAAGKYWLLDIDQSGIPYKAPLCINEMGAEIYRLICQGHDTVKISEILAVDYGISSQEIIGDIESFIDMLAGKGIVEKVI